MLDFTYIKIEGDKNTVSLLNPNSSGSDAESNDLFKRVLALTHSSSPIVYLLVSVVGEWSQGRTSTETLILFLIATAITFKVVSYKEFRNVFTEIVELYKFSQQFKN